MLVIYVLLRALSIEAAKLVAGSCLQLVFQAVLLGRFTSWKDFKVSQVISILSSALMITKVAVEIMLFQRANPNTEPTEDSKTMKEKVRELACELMNTLKKFLFALPLLLSSLVFNTGTLILTIVVTEWASAFYVCLVLLLNLTISFLDPYSILQTVEQKLKLTYKFSKLEEEEEVKRVKKSNVLRGLFTSWANLFIFLRPVENMSYHKITQTILLQPVRFLVNITTLSILVGLTWTPPHRHTQVQEISLIVSFFLVFAAGLINMLEFFRYFYFCQHFCLSKPPRTEEVVELADMTREKLKTDLDLASTASVHSAKDLEDAAKDEKSSLLSEMTISVKDETTNKEEVSDINPEEVKEITENKEKTSIHLMTDFENPTKDEKTSLLTEMAIGVKDETTGNEEKEVRQRQRPEEDFVLTVYFKI